MDQKLVNIIAVANLYYIYKNIYIIMMFWKKLIFITNFYYYNNFVKKMENENLVQRFYYSNQRIIERGKRREMNRKRWEKERIEKEVELLNKFNNIIIINETSRKK